MRVPFAWVRQRESPPENGNGAVSIPGIPSDFRSQVHAFVWNASCDESATRGRGTATASRHIKSIEPRGKDMGLLDWLLHAEKHDASGGAHAPPSGIEFDKHEEELQGLNMKQAIDAHVNWRQRLEQALAGTSSETLQVGQVASDDRCILGQWLHNDARRLFAAIPEYRGLVQAHAEFHLLAGDILCDVHDGRHDLAREKLHRDFRSKSDRVQLQLVRLYAKVRQ